LAKIPLKPGAEPARVMLRQRDQLALFAVPPDGGGAALVWVGTVDYIIRLRNAGQYELCRDLKITMGRRELAFENLRDGIRLDTLDEIADVVVTGANPKGEPFKHRYTFDFDAAD